MDTVREELSRYIKEYTESDVSKYAYNSNGRFYEEFSTVDICQNFFEGPVEKLFVWEEEDYHGNIIVIYKYKEYYVFILDYFGSCGVCDTFKECGTLSEVNDKVIKLFNTCQIYEKLSEFTLEYPHPEFIEAFNKFKELFDNKSHIS